MEVILKKSKITKNIFNQCQKFNPSDINLKPLGWVFDKEIRYLIASNELGLIFKREWYGDFSIEKTHNYDLEGSQWYEYWLKTDNFRKVYKTEEEAKEAKQKFNMFKDKFLMRGQFYL